MFDTVHDRFKILEHFLQKNVLFNIEHKTVRKGKLLLYNVNDYFLKFIIRTNKDINKTYEIPFPFQIDDKPNRVCFSYRIDDLCRDNNSKIEFMRTLEPVQSKLYDKNLFIINTDCA